jgi:hypothetical protein
MAQKIHFGLIYKEYINGFDFHVKEISQRRGDEKIASLVSILSASVLTDITTGQMLRDLPDRAEIIRTVQDLQNEVYLMYLIHSGAVTVEEMEAATLEFKEAYNAVAHRINIMFNVHLPPIQRFFGTKNEDKEGEQSLEQTEQASESPIIIAK